MYLAYGEMTMPRRSKDGLPFDQQKYIHEWAKQNMKQVTAQYKASFVNEFKEACKILNVKQSDIFRQAMQATIEKAKQKDR